MIALAALPALAGRTLDFLKSPLGILLVVAGAYLVGYWRGDSAAGAKCEERAKASVEAARAIDQKAATEARAAMEQQIRAAQEREAAQKQELETYAQILRTRPSAGCTLDDVPAGRLRLEPVPGSQPQPPRNH